MKKKHSNTNQGRREFLRNGLALAGGTGALMAGLSGVANATAAGNEGSAADPRAGTGNGELLYNGIRLPETWPPRDMRADTYDPMPVPYLLQPPETIPIDTGRQLFVDDFLIEHTDLQRRWHQPVKHPANPVLKPATPVEMNQGYCPMAAPFSDGVFYDPADKLFKMWYMAGWFDGTALATSTDGIHWERPVLDVVPGTNLVLAPRDNLRRDGSSVWLDHEAKDPAERFKMYQYARTGAIGQPLDPVGGFLHTSPYGIHWTWGGKITPSSDNNTFFYNPFRKKWVFTIRRETRPVPPWANPLKKGGGRARSYWENDNFQAALDDWKDAVFWFGADRLDPKKSNYPIGEEPQIYKVDAAGYESLMLGLIQPHYGPANRGCAKGGFPKLTELQLAFSRDGFHWDRTCRETFIGGEPDKKDSWQRGYIHSIGGVCNVVGDKLHFYYTAFRGNEQNRNPIPHWNGMYANASTGLAILRRDGFASMDTEKEGVLLTRRVLFNGSYLFVNLDGLGGLLSVEVCGVDGQPLDGYTRADCVAISANSTKQPVSWKNGSSLASFAGKPIRFKFYLTRGKLYAFWVSRDQRGVSGGAIAAGGPGLNGYWDV